MNFIYDDNNQLVSSIYVYIKSTDATRDEISSLLPYSPLPDWPAKLKYKQPHVWSWCTKWHYGNNIDRTIDNFIHDDIPQLANGLKILRNKYSIELSLHMVIGTANSVYDVTEPFHVSRDFIKLLAEWDFDLYVFEDNQIGGNKNEIDKRNIEQKKFNTSARYN